MTTDACDQVYHALDEMLQQWWPDELERGAYFELLQRQLAGITISNRFSELKTSLVSLPLLCGLAAEEQGAKTSVAELLPVLNFVWYCLYRAGNTLDDAVDGDIDAHAWGRNPATAAGIAVNSSIGLISMANLLLDRISRTGGATPARISALQRRYQRAILEMSIGQHEELLDPAPSLEKCWLWTQQKSGPCFAVACWSGASLACGRQPVLDLFWDFGYHLGVLLQIKDDLVDIWERNGRCSDIGSGAGWSLPVSYAMHVLEPEKRALLMVNLETAVVDPDAADAARQIVVESGAVLYLMAKAQMTILSLRRMLASLREEEVQTEELESLVVELSSFT